MGGERRQLFRVTRRLISMPKQINEIKDFLLTARRKDAKCTLGRGTHRCLVGRVVVLACHPGSLAFSIGACGLVVSPPLEGQAMGCNVRQCMTGHDPG